MGGRFKFKVFDEDTLSDELIGSFELNAKDIIGDDNGKFFWKNIYGAPKGCSNDAADEMNENPKNASFWKGRILMQVEAVQTDKPFLRFEDIVGIEENEKSSSSSDGNDSDGEKAALEEEHKHN